jgi:class 3 adenylate cyclase
VHADAEVPAGEPGCATEAFYQELQRLNTRHNGRLDPYVDATALVTFEDPGAAVRMALQLQQAANGVQLRIGVVSGLCTLAYFRAQGRLWCTPLGRQPARAAEVARSAAVGGIVISPETYEPSLKEARRRVPVQQPMPDFHDSELDLSSLAYDSAYDGIDIRC